MRFPDLPGHTYESLLEEDPFAWTFVASHPEGGRRAVRVFKSQATNDRFLLSYCKVLADPGRRIEGIDPVFAYALQTPEALAACATPFHGWRGREEEPWQIASLRGIRHLLAPSQILEVLGQLADAIAALHHEGLFHGGLRPSEIYLGGDERGGQRVHVSGFGQVFMGGLQYLEAGDYLFYTAPEQLATGDFSEGRGQIWDLYSFGAVAFHLLTGHLPRLDTVRRHHEENPGWLEATAAIAFGELSETTEYFLSQIEQEQALEWPVAAADSREEALRDVIAACLETDPARRPPTMDAVASAVHEALRLIPGATPASAAAAPAPAPVSANPAKERRANPAKGTPPTGPFEASPGFEQVAPDSGFSLRHFIAEVREKPVLRWQLTAIGALFAMLPLSGWALFSHLRALSAEKRVAAEVVELQGYQAKMKERAERQATAFRRDLNRKEEEKEQLESVLADLEGNNSNLLGQTKLARQILRQTQDNGDRFFQLVLENRDSDVPEFRAGRAAALEEGRKHYERLVEAYGDAPDFLVSTANALFYLGRIYQEMGEFGKSLASFGEAERRYSVLLEDERSAKVEFVKNIAISKQALGELSIREGQHAAARHYFTESSRFWTETRSRYPAIATLSALKNHKNSIYIVDCEFAMGRPEAALDAAMSVGVRLTEMQQEDPGNHRIVGALARSFSLVGRVLESRRQVDLARQAYQQSSDLYARAVQLDAASDDYQLGLGNSLARVGLLTNDSTKLEGAAEVLGRVVAGNPFESIYLKTLADIYGVLAAGQRDGGRVANAINLEQKAIAVLRPIVEANPSVAPDVRYSYSQRLAHLAELLGDSGKFDESRAPLKEAIALLEEIAGGEGAVPEFHRTLARTRGMAGFACMKSGNPDEAKAHLELAKSEWQRVATSNPEDDDAAQAVKWTSEQLSKLP